MHDARWAYRFLSKTLNDAFDPTFCVYRAGILSNIDIENHLTASEFRKLRSLYTNEDAEINNYNRSLAKVLHSSAWDGRC